MTINIFSGERGLGAALTNPTELARKKGGLKNAYPVRFKGYLFPDAETAYLTMRGADHDTNNALMVEILAEKFRQHKRLFNDVLKLGGVAWLEQCTHHTRARSVNAQLWEGKGRSSRFIRNLIGGFEVVLRETCQCDATVFDQNNNISS